jgi:ABC-type multidrug transport system fused ATPase/permease subunit
VPLKIITNRFDVIRKIFGLLTKKDIFKLRVLFVFQLLSSLFDLLGIFLIGMIGSLTINGIQSRNQSPRIESILNLMNLDNLTFQTQIGILGCLTGIVFILRTFLSLYFTKLTLNFLAYRAAKISSELIKNVLGAPYEKVKNLPTQEVIYGTTMGIEALVLRIIGSILTSAADMFLLLVILIGLTLYSVTLSVTLIIIFGSVSYLTYLSLSKKSYKLGLENARLSVYSGAKLSEALRSYRELYVRNRMNLYSEMLNSNRQEMAKTNATTALLPNISKYTIEAAVVIGTLLIAATQFALQDANAAITGMAVYLAAASRVAPSALRIQQGFLTIKNNLGNAQISLTLIETFTQDSTPLLKEEPKQKNEVFEGKISVKNVDFIYSDAKEKTLANISAEISQGEMLAVVGASGMGKSTFIDLILGVVSPTKGEIKVSNRKPQQAVQIWPGSMAYVPQNISIINGTIKENILIGFTENEISERQLQSAIIGAQLDEFIASLPSKENTLISENGLNLSGGQKQKIGIARALVTAPELLILDEATSSLDSKSESEIMKVINNLRARVTLIIVAHRLSTVKDADQIIYFGDSFHVNAESFQALVEKVPDFKEQAQLLGL